MRLKFLTFFFLIILFVTIFYSISVKYDGVKYRLDVGSDKVFGYCFRSSCYGLITENASLTAIYQDDVLLNYDKLNCDQN